ncbi:MAG: low temperature requirement protein A, partial [Sphingorhabdus sp.]
VFVFAITELSHRLLEHLSLHGAAETLILFMAIWWVWIYTSWSTNRLDPDHAPVRIMLLLMMVGGLVLSSSVGKSFDEAGLKFACAYLAMQLGRTAYMIWASHKHQPETQMHYMRMGLYFLLSTPFWISGAFADEDRRIWFWAIAIAIDYAGPLLQFRTPFIGKSAFANTDISGTHMAERCGLFIIIALGEVVLLNGTTFAKLEQEAIVWIAFITSFASGVAMWWIYFDINAEHGAETLEEVDNSGEVARDAYTYLHMPIVAGIVVSAVGYEMMLTYPTKTADFAFALAVIGGVILYLGGNLIYKKMTARFRYSPYSHGVGMALAVVAGAVGLLANWQLITLGMVASGLLIATAAWESFTLHRQWGARAG